MTKKVNTMINEFSMTYERLRSDCEMTWDYLIDFGMTWYIFDWNWDGFGTYDFGLIFSWLWVCENEHVKKSTWTLGILLLLFLKYNKLIFLNLIQGQIWIDIKVS